MASCKGHIEFDHVTFRYATRPNQVSRRGMRVDLE